MKKYSVLIPAYNVENYIVECVESIVKQDDMTLEEIYKNVEIIIADDGSMDKTGKICDELAKKYRNIQVYHKDNEGHLLTRTFLSKKAKSEYILFLDADDKWESNILKTLNNYIKKYNSPDIISFGLKLWKNSDYISYERNRNVIFCDSSNIEKAWTMLLCSDKYNSICCKAIKRDIVQAISIDEKYQTIKRGEDKVQCILSFEKSKNVLFIPDSLYDYRIDNESITRTFNPNYFDEIIIVDNFTLKKLKYISVNENNYIKWAENLLNKLIDYILDATSSLTYKDAKMHIDTYIDDTTVKEAIEYAKKSCKIKTKIKINLIIFKQYRILQIIYGRKS